MCFCQWNIHDWLPSRHSLVKSDGFFNFFFFLFFIFDHIFNELSWFDAFSRLWNNHLEWNTVFHFYQFQLFALVAIAVIFCWPFFLLSRIQKYQWLKQHFGFHIIYSNATLCEWFNCYTTLNYVYKVQTVYALCYHYCSSCWIGCILRNEFYGCHQLANRCDCIRFYFYFIYFFFLRKAVMAFEGL